MQIFLIKKKDKTYSSHHQETGDIDSFSSKKINHILPPSKKYDTCESCLFKNEIYSSLHQRICHILPSKTQETCESCSQKIKHIFPSSKK
jgi:hypothetical protein